VHSVFVYASSFQDPADAFVWVDAPEQIPSNLEQRATGDTQAFGVTVFFNIRGLDQAALNRNRFKAANLIQIQKVEHGLKPMHLVLRWHQRRRSASGAHHISDWTLSHL
jgi:hypothetical protein